MTIDDFDSRLAAIVGPAGLITEPAMMSPYLHEWRGGGIGQTRMVVRPADTAQVAEVVRLCAQVGIGIVPQGGNTGLCRGALAQSAERQVILNLSRLNRIRAIDPVNFTMTVEAGVILETIQQKAEEAGCFFPLSLGAEGSCTIGGNISTNAGGTGVLHYGNTRALVYGLEVVMPDGRIWDGLRILAKDNTGYDLKHLFIGAEGSLGIVTAAVVKLFPKLNDVQTAFCALSGLDAALPLLSRARAESGDEVVTFELMSRRALDLDLLRLPGAVDPLPDRHDWYVLMEFASPLAGERLQGVMEAVLAKAIEDGLVADAVLAHSIDQRNALWRLREELPEAIRKTGPAVHHDVSVPTSDVPVLIVRTMDELARRFPGVRAVPFGHVGDGNMHLSIVAREGATAEEFAAESHAISKLIYDLCVAMRGSFSAEHGIGRLKVDELVAYKAPLEVELMRRVKQALDPQGIMNPGAVVTSPN